MVGFRDKGSKSLVLAVPENEASKMKDGICQCWTFPDLEIEWVPPSEAMDSLYRREVRLSLEVIHRGRRLVVTEPYGQLRPSIRIWKTNRNTSIDRLLIDAVEASLKGPLGLGSMPVKEICMEGIRTFGTGVEIEVLFTVKLDPESQVGAVAGQHWESQTSPLPFQEGRGNMVAEMVP